MQNLSISAKSWPAPAATSSSATFRSGVAVETKDDESPVTIADRQAEEIMREMIMKAYPDHGIIGEEFGVHNEDGRLSVGA